MAARGHQCWKVFQQLCAVGNPLKGALKRRSFSYIAVKPVHLDIAETACTLRRFHLTCTANGLDDFFQKGDDLIEDAEKTGIFLPLIIIVLYYYYDCYCV